MNGVSVPNAQTKQEIYKLIEQLIAEKTNQFNVKETDELCRQNGIEVLKLFTRNYSKSNR